MLTASHLPWNRNGMKFFTRTGGLGKKDISALVDGAAAAHAAAQGVAPVPPAGAPAAQVANFLPVYASQLVSLIRAGVAHPTHYDTPLAGFKIVVDAGNGSGGFFAAQVLAPLGADTAGSQFLDPDGNFPNHVPNPEEAEAVASAAAAVRAAGADLGVIFDTDVDRSAIIDRAGVAINRNRLIALLAAVVLRERPGATIVTDSVTSDGLAQFIAAAGGTHYRYKRGYKNVIDKGVELAAEGVDAPLMIETSGHGAMAENHYLDDGAYLAVKVLVEAGRRRLAGAGGVEQLLVRPRVRCVCNAVPCHAMRSAAACAHVYARHTPHRPPCIPGNAA
jgi:phosphomannomutase